MFDPRSDLAALVFDGKERPDALLAAFAARLVARGHKPTGLIQTGTCDGTAKVLAARVLHSGEEIALGESRGPGASGCILDVGQLLQAGMRISEALQNGAELLIVNRFGKQESEGKGLLFLIEEAMARNIPVVIAVARSRWGNWMAFTQGMSVLVPSNLDAMLQWWD